MNACLSRCREAWRGRRVVPVQYLHAASPHGFCLRRNAGRDPFSRWMAVAALLVWPFSLATVSVAAFMVTLATAIVSVAVLETLFAAGRSGQVTPGWYLPAWLFALAAPAGAGPMAVGFAIGLGVLTGRLLFGGPGKQLVSPVLLGLLFLYVAYPGSFETAAAQPVWMNQDWPVWTAFVGLEARLPWGASPLACLAGAVILVLAGVLSWRTLAGGLLGLGLACGALSLGGWSGPAWLAAWVAHAVAGGFAFGLVFLAADPGSAPLTTGGRWFLGLASGVLTVLIRTLDPAHPDGTLHAVLLAGLFVPLADEWFVWRAMAVRKRIEESWP